VPGHAQDALKPLKKAFAGHVRHICLTSAFLKPNSMSKLASMCPSAATLTLRDCTLAPSSITEAAQGLPHLTTVHVDGVGHNSEAIINGMTWASRAAQRKAPLEVQLQPKGIRGEGVPFGSRMSLSAKRREVWRVSQVMAARKRLANTGKVQVKVGKLTGDSFEEIEWREDRFQDVGRKSASKGRSHGH